MNYLNELGYFPKVSNQKEWLTSDEQMREAIKSFQRSHQIPISGFIDEQSCILMNQPKCAGMIFPDSFHLLNDSKHRIRRYATFELKWPSTNLTWR